MIKTLFRLITGWKRVKKDGRTVWFHPLPTYDGYSDYNYTKAVQAAFDSMKANPKKFSGGVAVIRFSEFFSSGRPGIGLRRVVYTIGK